MYPNDYRNHHTEDTIAFFSLPWGMFDNWSAHQVKIFGRTFATVEAAYQFAKFQTSAPAVAAEIAAAPSPWKVFQITNQYRTETPADWNDRKLSVMEKIVRAKVMQNEDVRQKLLESGERVIVENSPWDTFWGSGPDGKGKNMLGRIYMRIRSELVETKKS